MFVRLLPLIAGLAPIIGANLALAIGVAYETIPACFPYVDGCVSISATGRQPPGNFVFRAVHLPLRPCSRARGISPGRGSSP